MISKILNTILMTLLLATFSIGQDNLGLILKAGVTKFNFDIGGVGGEGRPYYKFWNGGYQFSAGIEFPLNETFSFQGLAEYSSYSFDTYWAFHERVNNAKNQVFDLMGNIKSNLGIFYLIAGVGVSVQTGDEVKYLEKNENLETLTLYPSRDKIVLAGMLGLGFDIMIYDQISLITEVDIRIREYAGVAALLGIKYNL